LVVVGGCWRRLTLRHFAGGCGALAEAFAVHFEEGRVMDQSVDGGDGHGFVREDLIPAAEGLVGGDGDAAVLVAPGDQLEEDAGLGLVLVGIGDVIEVEAEKRAFRGKDRPPTSAQTGPVWPGRP